MTAVEVPAAALVWLRMGERGTSSEAIFTCMTGMCISQFGSTSHPLDADDLRRCRLLLEAVPEFAARLDEMIEVSPYWAKLVPSWDHLCNVMDAEYPGWRNRNTSGPGSKTYAAMRKLGL